VSDPRKTFEEDQSAAAALAGAHDEAHLAQTKAQTEGTLSASAHLRARAARDNARAAVLTALASLVNTIGFILLVFTLAVMVGFVHWLVTSR
jgi:hypothetical protein